MLRPRLAVLGGLILLTGVALLAGRGYLRAKALLADQLIDASFRAHLADGRPHRPWGWADTWPVAEIEVERLRVRRHVLAGASGSSLAFGLGHVDGTSLPGATGNAVVAGHRDTWAAFLRDLAPGDALQVRTAAGRRTYRVEATSVTAADDASALEQTAEDRLTLVTCYPFDAVVRSPQRYIVRARASDRRPEPPRAVAAAP